MCPLKSHCSQTSNIITLDHIVQNFNNGIQQVAKIVIPRGKKKNDLVPYWKDHNIGVMTNERDSILQGARREQK